ncbi:ATP-binding protein [Paracraurococcus ruber]|uniref:ATP-binding protein n=1 Tax=Paracraurococcus ruber TaxID=77675 RepID=UPI0013050B70|nr:ATP-binding protein [Paracraurococcus ruber]
MQGRAGGTAPDTSFERSVPAREDALAGLLDAVESFAAAAGLPPLVANRLLLVVEELAVNTVTHGTCGEPPATGFHIRLRLAPDGVSVEAEDDGREFDPTRPVAPLPDQPLAARAPGGAGLHIIGRVATDLAYRRLPGRNRLTCLVPLPG